MPLLEPLNHLQRCDCTTRNKRKAAALGRRMDELEARIVELRAQEELDAIRPPLDGRAVMDHLGVPPGRIVGEALDFLLEVRLDEGPLDEEEAYARLTPGPASAASSARRRAPATPGPPIRRPGSTAGSTACRLTVSWWRDFSIW